MTRVDVYNERNVERQEEVLRHAFWQWFWPRILILCWCPQLRQPEPLMEAASQVDKERSSFVCNPLF